MRRYFFHTQDGVRALDDTGAEFADLSSVRNEAIKVSGALLRDGADVKLWDGTPWRLWVTDRPDGRGEVFCELHFSAVKAGPKQ
jgi:hypothetical protein